MFIKYRPARTTDFDRFVSSSRDAFAYDAEERKEQCAMWKDLFSKGQLHAPMIEDAAPGSPYGFIFFCLFAFLTEDFVKQLHEKTPPMSSKYLLQLWKSGELPFLTQEEIVRDNSTCGVHMLVLTSGVNVKAIESGILKVIGSKVVEFHPYSLNGFRMNSMHLEMYDDIHHNWSETFGYTLLSDYREYFAAHGNPHPEYRPHLYGTLLEEVKDQVGSAVSIMFHYTPPLFGFSEAEQEMLLWAMSGDTNQALSKSLFLSSETIKKRWQSIYRKVAEAMPELFAGLGDESGKQQESKKKHLLLAYLQHHMQELRPYDPKLLTGR